MKMFKILLVPILLWVVTSASAANGIYKIDRAIPDYLWQYTLVNPEAHVLHIPDVNANKARRIDILRSNKRRNAQGKKKYFVEDGVVKKRPNWKDRYGVTPLRD